MAIGARRGVPQAPPVYIGFFNLGSFSDGIPHCVDSSNGGATCTSRASFVTYTPHNTAMLGCPECLWHPPTGKIWVSGSRGITTTDWQGTSIELAYMTDADHLNYDSSPDFAALTSGGSAQQVWNDGWFVDPGGQVYMQILAVPNATTSPLQCYSYLVPVDLTTSPVTCSAPIGPIAGTGFPTSILNPAIRKIGSTYHYFVKNDDAGRKSYEIMTRSSIGAGGWTVLHGHSTGSDDFCGWGAPREALAFLDLPDGSLRAFLDPEGAGMKYSDSADGNPLGPWSAPANITAPFQMQHGNFVVNPWG